MRWESGRRSANVEDRRGRRIPVPGGRPIAISGSGLLIILVMLLLGVDPAQILQVLGGGVQSSVRVPSSPVGPRSADEDQAADFVSVVLGDTEDVWTKIFAGEGREYQAPTLILFTGAVNSACGLSTAATGPFYCPGDRNVYLDLSFFSELKRLGGKGDFAAAYVVAHEVGHHVQNLRGTLAKVAQAKQSGSESEANALQVGVELQADCFAGVWAHHGNTDRNILEEGDVEEGIATASAIGDDKLQERAGRAVRPESFTHGSAKQRSEWFLRGLKSGLVSACASID